MNLMNYLWARKMGGSSGSSGGSSDSGGASQLDALIDGSITEIVSNVETVRNHLFYQASNLKSVSFPKAKEVGENAFYCCTSLEAARFDSITKTNNNSFLRCAFAEFNFSKMAHVGSYSFSECGSLTIVDLPVAVSVGSNAFRKCEALKKANLPLANSGTEQGNDLFASCTSLQTASFGAIKKFGYRAFENCSSLVALLLRSNTATTLTSTTAFNGSAIASGTGYIYVPSALVDTYKAATNWSTYADQFRALEDYTVDGTITGELDESKI